MATTPSQMASETSVAGIWAITVQPSSGIRREATNMGVPLLFTVSPTPSKPSRALTRNWLRVRSMLFSTLALSGWMMKRPALSTM